MLGRPHFCPVIVIGQLSLVYGINCAHHVSKSSCSIYYLIANQNPRRPKVVNGESCCDVVIAAVYDCIARIVSVNYSIITTESRKEVYIEDAFIPGANLCATLNITITTVRSIIVKIFGVLDFDNSVISQRVLCCSAFTSLLILSSLNISAKFIPYA